MATNLERFKQDLKRLVIDGHDLQLAFYVSAYGSEAGRERLVHAGLNEEDIDKAVKSSSHFKVDYERWYSESLAVIKQILPDRLRDFRDLYERPTNRKNIDFLSYVIADAIIGLEITRGGERIADAKAAIPKFQAQLSILQSAKSRFASSLYDIQQLVQADLFNSEIDSARHLLKNRFFRAAGAIAGVVLEKHLKLVCAAHNLKITKRHPSIGDLNELLKGSSTIDVPQWRQITFLADVRNLCDHDKTVEPSSSQVVDLIDGVDKILKTVA